MHLLFFRLLLILQVLLFPLYVHSQENKIIKKPAFLLEDPAWADSLISKMSMEEKLMQLVFVAINPSKQAKVLNEELDWVKKFQWNYIF